MTFKAAFSFADGKTLFCPVGRNESVLDAALKNGIRLPFDCREGVCATCKGQCESGKYTLQYVDEDALNDDDLARGHVLTCQTHLQSDATFSFHFDAALCADTPTHYYGIVRDVQRVSSSTAILTLTMEESCGAPDYLPGQYAQLTLPGHDDKRAYSFSNWPATGDVTFLIRLLPDGLMSNYLRESCQPGDRIAMDAPFGTFYLRDVTRPVVMMAGGTGLSAFLAMLDKLALEGCDYPVHLLYGVRTSADICEAQRLRGYSARLRAFSVEIVLSAPDDEWQGKTGYITDNIVLPDACARGFDLYVCGPPALVDGVNHWVNQADVPDIQVYYEKFIPSHR